MKDGRKFSGLMMVCGIAAILYGVQLLFSIHGVSTGLRHCFWLLIYSPSLFLFNALLLYRERTVIQTVIVNGTIMVLALLALFSQVGTGGGKQVAVTICYYLFVTYYSVKVNLNKPRENHLILTLDIGAMLSIVLTVMVTAVDRALLDCLPVFVGSVCVLLGLMEFRLHSLRLWLIPTALLLLMISVFFGLMALAKPIGSLLTTVFGGAVSGLKYIGSQIERLLRYLTSFLEAESYEEISGETFGIPSGAMETAQQFQDGMGIIIGLIILVFFLFVLIIALRIFGKSGIGGEKLATKKYDKNHATKFLPVFRNWLLTCRENIHYAILVIRRRNTPWGLYFILLAAAGKGSLGLKAGETPKAFLLRLAEHLPRSGAELFNTIPEIEKALFSRNRNFMRVEHAGKIILETVKKARLHR